MSGATILVVDDHPTNLKLCKVMLSVDGYDVHTAADAEEALAVLDSVHPRLILMDLQLPGMDGLQLTRQLKANPTTRDIVVVALTAYAMQGDEQQALEAGCDGYLAKPIDTRLLVATVERYLARSGKEG